MFTRHTCVMTFTENIFAMFHIHDLWRFSKCDMRFLHLPIKHRISIMTEKRRHFHYSTGKEKKNVFSVKMFPRKR